MKRPRSSAWLMLSGALALAGSGCGNEDISGPVDVFAIAPDASGHYGIRRVPLGVRDPHTLDCDELSFVAGATIYIDDSAAGSARLEGGAPVDLALSSDDGAYAARDFDGLIAMTAAHHLLAAREYFDDLGLSAYEPAFPPRRVVLYPPSVTSFGGFGGAPSSDNAFFSDALDGFAILREKVLDDGLPLAANLGVMTHEFAHAVFSHLRRDSVNGLLSVLLVSLNEGLADVHGAAITGDPGFVGVSVPFLAEERNLASPRVYSQEGDAAAVTNPYWYGSLVASTFWDFRSRLVETRNLTEPDARRRMATVAFVGVRDYQLPTKVTALGDLENGFWIAAKASAQATGDDDLFCASLKKYFPPGSRPSANPLPSAVCP